MSRRGYRKFRPPSQLLLILVSTPTQMTVWEHFPVLSLIPPLLNIILRFLLIRLCSFSRYQVFCCIYLLSNKLYLVQLLCRFGFRAQNSLVASTLPIGVVFQMLGMRWFSVKILFRRIWINFMALCLSLLWMVILSFIIT